MYGHWLGRPKYESLRIHKGLVAPLSGANVDTDAIIPRQFLKSIRRSGFGAHLFDAWRYLEPGFLGQDPATRTLNPGFVLNHQRYRAASILLARENFGCGSSREHAVWALAQHGFHALVAPSFADIFYNNCLKNGLLPVVLAEHHVSELFREIEQEAGFELTIDLVRQAVIKSNGTKLRFEIEPFHRYCMMRGGWMASH